eukprot:gene26452-28979_t
MRPHPEGGWFVETFRDAATVADPAHPGGRPASTAIYFLLEQGQVSHWHE